MPLLLLCKISFFACAIIQIVLCFFFYNYAGFDVLLWLGWIMLLVGLILFILPPVVLGKRGGVPEGKDILHTTVLVDSGIYGVVRHPQYLGSIFAICAFILISQYWLSAVIVVFWMVLAYITSVEEEKYLLKKFGDAYKRYMEKVPRMNFLLGIIMMLRRRNK